VKNSLPSWLPSVKNALRRVQLVAVVLTTLLLSSAPARADIITLSADTFATGVDVSHALSGATLQRIRQQAGAPTYTPIATPVVTNGAYFGGFSLGFDSYESCYNNAGIFACQGDPFQALELTFNAPTDYVSIVGDFGNDAPGMLAYRSDGSLIAGCGAGVGGSRLGCVQTIATPGGNGLNARSTLSITGAQGDIARIVWGSFAGVAFANEVSYNAPASQNVPEPGTLLLFAIGMVGSAGSVLRKRRQDA
jgi:hypothetical protein